MIQRSSQIASSAFFVFLFFFSAGELWARPAQVVLMRHGEKPEIGDELSDKGWQRAQALPDLLKRPDLTQFGAPVALFAMVPTDKHKSKRAIQTLQFLAQTLKLPIDTEFDRDRVDELTQKILNTAAYDGKAVWVCWEHKILLNIAKALGIESPPGWPGDQFDRAWVITYDSNGQATLADLPERLLPGDSND